MSRSRARIDALERRGTGYDDAPPVLPYVRDARGRLCLPGRLHDPTLTFPDDEHDADRIICEMKIPPSRESGT